VITGDGLMFHVGHLTQAPTPEALFEVASRTVTNIAAVRRHFGVG
jgi:hypothetical protein